MTHDLVLVITVNAVEEEEEEAEEDVDELAPLLVSSAGSRKSKSTSCFKYRTNVFYRYIFFICYMNATMKNDTG